MMRFWRDCLIATIFVFVVLWGLYKIAQFDVFNALDPLGKALDDMEITDVTFSRLRLEVPPYDENITLVNIGNLNRAGIAEQIRMISQFKPRVIGIDSFFDCPGGKTDSINCPLAYDTLSNLLLANAIAEAGNVVMVTKLLQSSNLLKTYGDDSDLYDSIEHSDEIIRGTAYEGFANLVTNADHQEDLKVCRSFVPSIEMPNGEQQLAFAVKVAMLYDSVKAKKILERDNDEEVINYRGNVPDPYKASAEAFANRYSYLDWYQPFDTASFLPSLIEDRIVLFGYMGNDINDTSWDDKFITPLNKQFAGKTRPDMYGVVVHANIISMILNEDYINEMAEWQEYAVAFILCFLNMALFSLMNRKIPLWFDGLSVLLQLTQIVLFTFIMMYVLYWFDFKLNLTIALLAIALAGTCFEIYINFVKVLIKRYRAKSWITKDINQVLTPQNPDH